MKKLYAKTSFARKNSNKSSKQQLVDSNSLTGTLEKRQKYQHEKLQPILAFQTDHNNGYNYIYAYKQYFKAKSYNDINCDNDEYNDGDNDDDDDDGFLINKNKKATTPNRIGQRQMDNELQNSSHLYYSIAELSRLNMTDHRHPQYEHQRNVLRRLPSYNQQNPKQHAQQPQQHKLVLQVPMPSQTIDGDSKMYAKLTTISTASNYISRTSSVSGAADKIKNNTEAPQIVNNITKLPVSYISNSFPTTASTTTDSLTLFTRRPNSIPASGTEITCDSVVDFYIKDGDDDDDIRKWVAADDTHSNRATKFNVAAAFSSVNHNDEDDDDVVVDENTSTSILTSSTHNSKRELRTSVSFTFPKQHQHEQHRQNHQRQLPLLQMNRKCVGARQQLFAAIFSSAEQSIIGARASVMVYDDNQKKWVPSGTSSGLSKVQIYHHQQNNTFRVVGRKLQDHEVVINCSIMKGLKYNQATATFHQWRDSKYVYGLNFSSQQDAEAFARAMMHALEVLSGRVASNPGLPTNGNGYEEDMGYRTMTSEDAAILRQQQSITGQVTPSAQTPTSQTNQNNIPQSPPTPQGHHRTSRNSLSAPPAPQPQQMSMPQQQQQQQQQQQHLYGPSNNGPTQNGLHQTQSHQQIPPAPGQASQYQQQAQQHAVYASQGYPPNQYQQTHPHYMLTNSNSNVNLQQYSPQQQLQQTGPPQPPVPPHQANGMMSGVGSGAPIYVTSQAQLGPGLPTSASANNVYTSQQQMGGIPQPPQPPQPPMMQQQQNGPPMGGGYGQQNGIGMQESPYGHGGNSNTGGGVPMPPPLNRMSSTNVQQSGAPAAPPPPPSFGGGQQMYNGGGSANIPQPPAPPAPPMGAPPIGGGAAPPPPPPPPTDGGGGGGGSGSGKKGDPQSELMDSLALQLQQVKLKKKASSTTLENSGSSTNSGGSAGNYGTIGRGSSGMASMMDEMAKTLARRRAQAEKKDVDVEPEVKQRPWEKSNTLPHKLNSSSANSATNQNSNATSNSSNESPRPLRKRFGSASEETILQQVNGDGLSIALTGGELETLKADILREMRQEMQKIKQDIIEVIKSEFNRR